MNSSNEQAGQGVPETWTPGLALGLSDVLMLCTHALNELIRRCASVDALSYRTKEIQVWSRPLQNHGLLDSDWNSANTTN